MIGHTFYKSNIFFDNILLNGDGNAHSYLNLSLLIISVFIQSRVTISQVWWFWTPQSDLYNVKEETYHNLISSKIFKIKGPVLVCDIVNTQIVVTASCASFVCTVFIFGTKFILSPHIRIHVVSFVSWQKSTKEKYQRCISHSCEEKKT